MQTNSQRPKRRDGVLSTLIVTIETLNLAKEICSITPARAAFGSVSALLTMIKESMISEQECVDLGLSCADVCNALDRGLKGRRLDELSQSVFEAINQLTTTVAEIERKITKHGERNAVSRLFHAKNDKENIVTWKLNLNRILHIFNTELGINTHGMVTDIHRIVLNGQGIGSPVDGLERRDGSILRSHKIGVGEVPPPAPRACFGRDELVERIVGLAENLTPIALVGPGGIGKTSIALTVLHHDRIKKRFGINRRFIRCDQFTASCPNLLRRLSKVIGADIEHSEDLTPLRPSLTSQEMLIVLDNAESVLDPQGVGGQEINAVVEELSQFSNVCLCITSRITTVPPDCETLDIPTLSMGAARDAFYRIYKYDRQSDPVNNILDQLDFHPLSVTLLATVAHQNKWNGVRLTREWRQRQTGVLQTGYNKSLARTIELSLASPMFRELGPDARGLLEAIAFFPQGMDENNLDWLFPSISNRTTIFDTFCVLSLTYRNNGFTTMLAPLRDYLRPQGPMSSTLLSVTKDRYFTRMSIKFDHNTPVFTESRWILTEDVNVEHLVDVCTSIDANVDEVWDACANFIGHLRWHKPRHTILRQKIEGLPDDHPHKTKCSFELARLFNSVGNHVERKRLLCHTLKLVREQGDDDWVAWILKELADANRKLGRFGEGIQQAREALEIYQRLGTMEGRAECLGYLALLLHEDKQPTAAKEAVSHAIDLLPERGEREEAIHHLEAALAIASPFSWHDLLFWIHRSLAELFAAQDEFGRAHSHIEQAKSYAVNDAYTLGRAMHLQAEIWYRQSMLKEAMSEASRAFETFENLGAAEESRVCGALLQEIERALTTDNLDYNVYGSPSSSFVKSRFSRFFKQE